MKDIQTIKQRLAAIQGNFNPQKNTYKVIEHVVNNDLTYNEMLMKLSEIKGFSKYPEELKNEYISIINDIKESIINQRKKEEKERQEANTKELKDIINSLEKRKKEYIEQLKNVAEEQTETKTEKNTDEAQKEAIDQVLNNNELEKNEADDDEEKLERIKKVLLIGIGIVIVLIVIVLLLY